MSVKLPTSNGGIDQHHHHADIPDSPTDNDAFDSFLPRRIYGRVHFLSRGKNKKQSNNAVADSLGSIDMESQALLIGRGDDCDARIHSLEVSRLHAKVEVDDLTGQVRAKRGPGEIDLGC